MHAQYNIGAPRKCKVPSSIPRQVKSPTISRSAAVPHAPVRVHGRRGVYHKPRQHRVSSITNATALRWSYHGRRRQPLHGKLNERVSVEDSAVWLAIDLVPFGHARSSLAGSHWQQPERRSSRPHQRRRDACEKRRNSPSYSNIKH